MLHKNKGVLTIEAALIMPLVMYVVFIMIFTFLFIYSRVYLALSVDHVVAQVTAQWYSRGSDFDTIKSGKNSIIAEAFATAFSTDKKVAIVKTKLKDKVDSGIPMKVDFSSDVSVFPYVVGEQMTIKTNCTYKLPLSGLFKFFGMTKDGMVHDSNTKVVNLSNNEANMRTIAYTAKLLGRAKANAKSILDKVKSSLSKGGQTP